MHLKFSHNARLEPLRCFGSVRCRRITTFSTRYKLPSACALTCSLHTCDLASPRSWRNTHTHSPDRSDSGAYRIICRACTLRTIYNHYSITRGSPYPERAFDVPQQCCTTRSDRIILQRWSITAVIMPQPYLTFFSSRLMHLCPSRILCPTEYYSASLPVQLHIEY